MSEAKIETMQIRLIGGNPSAWKKEGVSGADAINMSVPSRFRILPECSIQFKDKDGIMRLKKLRYLSSMDTIDYEEQEEILKKKTPAEKERILDPRKNQITVEWGMMNLERSGSQINLFDFIKSHEWNAHNSMRPKNATVKFEELIEEEIAQTQNNLWDDKVEALTALTTLRKKEGDVYVYDEAKMNMMVKLFKIPGELSKEVQYRQLTYIANENPKLIQESILNSKKQFLATLIDAEKMSVIAYEDNLVRFTKGSAMVIMEFKTKLDKNQKTQKLLDYLLSSDGKKMWEQLNIDLNAVNENSLALK